MSMNTDNQKIDCWIDCDPGIDDTFALILAAYSPKINLIGVSTVSGNSSIKAMTSNALKVLNLIGFIKNLPLNENLVAQDCKTEVALSDFNSKGGLDIPVIQGNGYPFLGKPVNSDHIHGENGLVGDFPTVPNHAIDFVNKVSQKKSLHFTTQIYNHLKLLGKKITILAIGPLTNVGLLLFNYPDVKNYVEKIVFMGGSIGLGNITPSAEFNTYSDPIAASIVCNSGLDVHMVPLEACKNANVTAEFISSWKMGFSTKFSGVIATLLEFLKKQCEVFYLDKQVCPLIDPVAAFYLIEPQLFQAKLMRVDVETGFKSYNYGQTTCDYYDATKLEKNVTVCYELDINGVCVFWEKMNEALLKANENSKLKHN